MILRWSVVLDANNDGLFDLALYEVKHALTATMNQ